MTWRKSDMISVATLVTLISWIWWASSKVSAWDGTVTELKTIQPVVEEHSKQLAVISESLSDMKDDLRYLRRHTQ